MVVLGFVCLFTPVAASFGVMYFYTVLLFAAGIMILIRCIASRSFGVDFFFSILTIIAGAFVLFSRSFAFATAEFLLYLIAAWLIIRGILGMVAAIRARRATGGGLCALGIIAGVILILTGLYSFVHPLYFAEFIGVLASVYFIVEGIDMVVAGCAYGRLTR